MINIRSYPIPKDIKKYEKIQKFARNWILVALKATENFDIVVVGHGAARRYGSLRSLK